MTSVAPDLLREDRFASMGTECSVLAPPDRSDGLALASAVFTEWDERFSRFRADSELSRLNARAGRETEVSRSMFAAVEAASDAARATDGLFDPLLGRRMVELGYDRTFTQLPAHRSALTLGPWAAGAWRSLALNPIRHTVTLPAGTALDLGGIAKGMAVDAALHRLVAAGFPYAAVNAGGDMAVHGTPPGMSAWPIAIELGAERDRVVMLPSGALATSSVLRRRWRTNGTEQHHLLDPRSGLPSLSGVVQASVAAASCRQAEVAAKAALLSGPVGGMDFLERHGLAGLLLTDDGAEWRAGSWTS